jgi:solute carrier family 35 protein F1/2
MLRSKSSQQGSLIRDDEARRGFAPIWFLKRFPLHASPWAYLGIAILDVEANYATVMSFKYTTLTSAAVFDNMAIPSAMVLSRLFLKRKYVWLHLVGVMICLGGITVNVLIDYKNDVRDSKEAVEAQHGDQQVNAADVVIAEEYPHRLLGDILAIVGGLLFGARDVLTEKTIRQGENSMEYLGMVGLFGTMISTVQVLLVERQAVTDFFTSSDSSCAIETGLLFLLSYVVANILRYFGTARFLLLSEAALLNLSLLTGDLWSALFSIIGEKIVPPALFWLALVLILSGVLVYEIAPSPIGKTSERIRDEVTGDASGCDFANPEGELEIPKISRAWIERI